MKQLRGVLTILVMVAAINVESLAEAIRISENSAKFPYGVKSIDTHGDVKLAKKITLNSINNALKRWDAAGRPKDFIEFFGDRWCPPSVHSLNRNWVKNVTYHYRRLTS